MHNLADYYLQYFKPMHADLIEAPQPHEPSRNGI